MTTRRRKAGALIVVALISAGCSLSTSRSISTSTTGSSTSSSTVSNSTTSTSGATTTIPATSTSVVAGQPVPVSVQSDADMLAAGNHGPSSSILVPSSCTVTSTTATAAGTYQGGFAPEIYHRYGDVVDLYVFSQPLSGYPEGIQVAVLSREQSPPIGGSGTWTVTVPVQNSPEPARCVVAAQPTHDFQGAPSAY
jgi:hypothetical protein